MTSVMSIFLGAASSLLSGESLESAALRALCFFACDSYAGFEQKSKPGLS